MIFCLFLDGFEEIFSNFMAFLRKFCLLGGIFVFSPPRSSGRISFKKIGPRKDKDFLLEYTPMSSAPEIPDVLLEVVGPDVLSVGALTDGTLLKIKIRTELVWKSVNLLP